MTKLLERAVEAVRRLPPDSQDEIAQAMMSLAGGEGEPERIDPTHLADVLESLAQAKSRQFATDAEVEAADEILVLNVKHAAQRREHDDA
jgi:hypothetical protein